MIFTNRTRYSRRFKRKVVELVQVYGGNPATVARNLGINHELLLKWLKKYKLEPKKLSYN